jgi:4-hydroxyacetophenone monooxygenase
MVECQVRYVMGCLKLQLENSNRAWGDPCVSSWYKNSAGRVTQNWPGTHWEWWQQTLAPNPEDFLLS